MRVLALDLATTTGWAYGEAGEKPIVDSWDLRMSHPTLVPGKLAYKLRLLFRDHGKPDFMAIESTLHPSAQPSAATIISQERLHGAALGVAGMYRIRKVLEVAPSTVRTHFCGQANAGNRDSTKAMVVRQAKLLGYGALTDDEADSVALFDYIVYVILRKPLKELRMFPT